MVEYAFGIMTIESLKIYGQIFMCKGMHFRLSSSLGYPLWGPPSTQEKTQYLQHLHKEGITLV